MRRLSSNTAVKPQATSDSSAPPLNAPLPHRRDRAGATNTTHTNTQLYQWTAPFSSDESGGPPGGRACERVFSSIEVTVRLRIWARLGETQRCCRRDVALRIQSDTREYTRTSRDVTVSRTLSTRTRSRPTHFPDHRPDRLATRSHANWNADVPRRSHASANEIASEPCRDAPVDQATAILAISAPPLPHLNRCAAAYREEYDGNEYGGLPVAAG